LRLLSIPSAAHIARVAAQTPNASSARRAIAVVVDFFVFYGIWIGTGFAAPDYAFAAALGTFLLVDVAGTAYAGVSVGRLVAGIRVVRVSDGKSPGLARAALRTVLTVSTGWAGLLVFTATLRFDAAPARLWWDAAAGTRLERAPARQEAAASLVQRRPSRPLEQWRFTWTMGFAFAALILCLFSLANGQSFPLWMALGLLVVFGAGVVSTYAKNTFRDLLLTRSQVVVTVGILLLGIGVMASSRPADAEVRSIQIASVSTGTDKYSGDYYDVTSTAGDDYGLNLSDFSPPLPRLNDARYTGTTVTLTLDRGTTSVLAIEVDDAVYTTATYDNPQLKLFRGLAIGGVLLGIALAMAIGFGYFKKLLRPHG